MIAKSFFNRFRPPPPDKPSVTPPTEKLLLKMLSFGLKLKNNEETLLRLSSTLSYNLDVDTVCISEIANGKIQIRQIFHLGENLSITKHKTPSDLVYTSNTETKENKPNEYCEDIRTVLIDRHLISNLNSAITCCVPACNENGDTCAFIHIFHSRQKRFSACENEILKLLAERLASFFKYEEEQLSSQHLQYSETDLSQQLRQTEEQLKATNKSLKSLSFAVSHELRAPLRSMDSFSKALIEDFTDDLPDEALSHVSRIRKACVRMGHMIDDLLWLARVSRGKIEPQNIELSKMAKKIALNLLEAENGKKVELIIQPNLTAVADTGLIKIVLQNLFSNAIKFSRHQDNATIEFFSVQQGNTLAFAVRDNGLGFDMAYHEQLFEPFKQLHSSNKFVGTGIGLATVERIIERHRGKIWADSDTGEGATFYFTLPGSNMTTNPDLR